MQLLREHDFAGQRLRLPGAARACTRTSNFCTAICALLIHLPAAVRATAAAPANTQAQLKMSAALTAACLHMAHALALGLMMSVGYRVKVLWLPREDFKALLGSKSFKVASAVQLNVNEWSPYFVASTATHTAAPSNLVAYGFVVTSLAFSVSKLVVFHGQPAPVASTTRGGARRADRRGLRNAPMSWEDAADDDDAWEVNELPADDAAPAQRQRPTTAPSGRRPWPPGAGAGARTRRRRQAADPRELCRTCENQAARSTIQIRPERVQRPEAKSGAGETNRAGLR